MNIKDSTTVVCPNTECQESSSGPSSVKLEKHQEDDNQVFLRGECAQCGLKLDLCVEES